MCILPDYVGMDVFLFPIQVVPVWDLATIAVHIVHASVRISHLEIYNDSLKGSFAFRLPVIIKEKESKPSTTRPELIPWPILQKVAWTQLQK